MVTAQLLGDTSAGFPNLLKINGVGLAATSTDPSYATDNVETVVMQNHTVTLGGMGFDTVHGVAIDLFCDCLGSKMPATFLAPGNPGLTATALSFTLPASAVTGPGSFVISNRGAKGDYAIKSNAVSVVIGAKVKLSAVKQTGCTVTVNGSGFAVTGAGLPPVTVINLFNRQRGGAVNLGGLSGCKPKIALDVAGANQFTFSLSGVGFEPGASYVQVLNPPFVPFSGSGNTATGAFTAASCAVWPMFHQNTRHTGLSLYSTAGDTGVMKWKFNARDIVYSSPAVGADGTIYVGSNDGNLIRGALGAACSRGGNRCRESSACSTCRCPRDEQSHQRVGETARSQLGLSQHRPEIPPRERHQGPGERSQRAFPAQDGRHRRALA